MRYAIVQEGRVINVTEADPDHLPEHVEKGIADMPHVREKYVAAGRGIVNKEA